MTVGELRALLDSFPQGAEVFVQGYESGFDHPAAPRSAGLEPGPCGASGVLGEFDEAYPGDAAQLWAVVIERA